MKNNDIKSGTSAVIIFGTMNTSLVANLSKSKIICNQPLRPAIDGPNRL